MNKRLGIKILIGAVYTFAAIMIIINVFRLKIDLAIVPVMFAVIGIIAYFSFFGIDYKHSIYGGRFKEHFKDDDEKDEQE